MGLDLMNTWTETTQAWSFFCTERNITKTAEPVLMIIVKNPLLALPELRPILAGSHAIFFNILKNTR